MTELKPMSEAPRDGTEILALDYWSEEKSWEIIKFYSEDWINKGGIYFVEDELLGWLPLPPIPD